MDKEKSLRAVFEEWLDWEKPWVRHLKVVLMICLLIGICVTTILVFRDHPFWWKLSIFDFLFYVMARVVVTIIDTYYYQEWLISKRK